MFFNFNIRKSNKNFMFVCFSVIIKLGDNMSASFTFSAVSFFYSLLLTIIFFSKKRLKTIENRIYSWAIISNLIGVVLAVSSYFLISKMEIYPILNLVISKLYIVYLLTYISILTLYMLIISFKNNDKITKEEYFNKCFSIISVIFLILLILVFVLPLYFHNENSIIYSYGPSANLIYAISLIYIVVWLVLMIKNYKELKDKKYLPMFLFILIGTVVLVIQKLNPGLLLMTAMETFVTFLMYFTIENPDIKLIEELNKSNQLAEKYNNDKSIFLFNMNQRLRTPLNKINIVSEEALEKDDINDVKEHILEIRGENQKLLNIINGVMDISNIDSRKIKIVENQYNLKNMLTEVSLKYEKQAKDKKLEFRTNFDSGLPDFIKGDSIRIKQIIEAIVSNAVEYTDEGFVEFNVNSVIRYDVCRLIITVKDSGKGIKKEEIDKLFEQREVSDLEEKLDKKNINLQLAKKMVNMIGGTLTVESSKNVGTEFTIIVDQKIEKSNNRVLKMAEEYKNITEKKQILFVDDVEEEQNLYNKKLSLVYKVSVVNGGENCLKKIRSGETYDFIILKEEMNKLDGIKVMEKLKKIKDFNIPVFLLTNKKTSKEKVKYIQLGFKDLIYFDSTLKQINEILK